jgi:hypothetical protein
MTGGRRTSTGWLPVAVATLVAVALGAVTNIFTGTLPESWTWARDWRLMGATFLVLSLLTVVLALVQHSQGRQDVANGSTKSSMSLRAVIDRFTFQYGRNYRRWVSSVRRTLDAKGLATIGPFSPELDAVFVHVALTSRAPGQVPSGLLGNGADDVQRRSVWDFLNRRPPVVLAVLGAPGSGKTTLLSHVARDTATMHREKLRPVPVLLQLRDHVAAVVADPAVTLPALIRATIPDLVGTEPAGWWESQLRAGRCVVLLDGLDEVAGVGERRAVVRWINTQLAVHPDNDFVITSRPHGYRDSFVNATATVQVLPFTPEQVKQFLRNWYRTAERHEADDADLAAVDARARREADHLLSQLDAIPGLHDLTVNPLLLTMIANVHRYGQRLPDNRATLYSEVCDVMVWRRDREKGRHVELPGPQRLDLLGRLAFHWMELGIRDLGRRALLDTLQPWLAEVTSNVTAERFLEEMEGTGLLLAPVSQEFTFAHQTFQEYLAARHIGENSLHNVLVKAVDDPWWRETTLLYAAENDSDPIVLSALRSSTANALSLAFEIAESGARISPPLRAQLNNVLRKGLQPEADTADRRIAVDVLVGRLLRAVTITRDSTRISRRPITEDLYRLFRSDTGTLPPDGPDQIDPDAPARGMWRSDTEAFVTWINTLVASGPRGTSGIMFRLPTPAELATLDPAGPVWVTDGSAPQVWHPPGEPTGITADDLAQATAADLHGSALLTSVLVQLALSNGDAVRDAAATVDRLSGELYDAAREFARASVVARKASDGVPPSRSREVAITQRLRGGAERMRQAAESLVTALDNLPDRDPQLVARLTRILDRVDVRPAKRTINQAARDSMNSTDLRLPGILTTLGEVTARLADARKLIDQHRPHTERQSPVDYTLAPVSNVAITLPVSDALDGDPAVTLASVLLPKSYRAENRSIFIDLDGLDAKLKRMSDASTRQMLETSGFDEALDRLVWVAEPIVTRRRPITPSHAAAVRAPALILARAAQRAGDRQLTVDLIELAAGMCLLEQRSRSPELLETLILAYG